MSLSTPRILPKHLEQFAPHMHAPTANIRLLGTITSIAGSQATLTTGDGDTVALLYQKDAHFSPQGTYEVVGKVVNLEGGAGLGVKVLYATEWPRNEQGKAPDLKLYEAVVEATHKYREIFYVDREQ